MLRCSRCGTLNADGNSFCSSCGMKLGRTSIRCPKCGASNPIGNIFCDKCQAKLISPDAVVPPKENDTSVATVKGISLPTRTRTDEAPAMPDWLQQLTENVRIDSFEEVSEGEVTNPSSDNQITPELPDWLTNLVDQDDGLVTGNIEEIEPETSTSFNRQDMPDWLLSGQDSVLLPGSDMDGGFIQAPTGDLPDWLSGIADEGEEPVQAASGAADWHPAGADDVDALDLDTSQSFMDWLVSAPDTEPDEITAFDKKDIEVPADEVQPGDAPDWLLANTADTDKPHWILDAGKLKPPAKDSPAPDTTAPELLSMAQPDNDIELKPDWMSIEVSDSVTEDNPIAEVSTLSDIDTPDWLDIFGEESLEVEEPDAPQLPLPPDIANEGLPAWLSELNVARSKVEDSQAVFTPESTDSLSNEIQKPVTPAWLGEVTPPSENIAIQPAAPAFIIPEEPSGSQIGQTLDVDASSEEGFPSWLNELKLPEQGAVIGYTNWKVDSVASAGISPDQAGGLSAADTDELVRADLPEWLKDLKPPEGSIWTPIADLTTQEAVASGNLSPGEVPEWVKTLRPKPGEQWEAASDGLAPEPAEIEGPLASLVGILPTSTAVDMPADYEVNIVKIPENVIRQAQLWQQLLGQPQSAIRKVVHPEPRSGSNLALMRLVMAITFILGSLAALLFLPGVNLAITAPGVSPLGVQKFVASVEALQPGQTVIVAIEYGWAQVDEMTAVAQAILNHLADREVNVIAVSTMPEGTSVIPPLLESSELSNVVMGSASYLSSSASGIASFLGEPEAQSAGMLIVLSSHYETLRWWLEQNQTTASAAGTIPLSVNVGLSASTGPLAAPYLATRNIQGWAIGFQDSVNYQTQRGIQNPSQAHIRDVLMLMHWGVVLLLVGGFLYALISGKKGVN